MKMTLPALLAATFLACSATTWAQPTPVGLWKTIDDESKQEKSLVRIVESGGALSGRVEKIADPAKRDAVCEACEGELKGRPVVGMTILEGVKRSADEAVWDGGTILDPNNGKVYKVRLTPTEGGRQLEVRGYVGLPLLGRTQTWVRVE